MVKLISFILTSLLLCHNINQVSTLVQSAIVSKPIGPLSPTETCPNNLATTCKLQCINDNYALDAKGCPKCACASDQSINPIGEPPNGCPLLKCLANCGDAGYKFDANGCRTCTCAPTKTRVTECSGVKCRMYCVNGFSRDENGCEVCKCNSSPQSCPQLNCENTCSNGYKKDSSGCSTCSCKDEEPKQIIDDGCSPMKCALTCPYGFEQDPSGCSLCSCNRCPLRSCRMFCMYGFKKNTDGCDLCECNWEPVSENIPCSERTPCEGPRVCNLNIKLCELVSPDKVNWFVYNFDIKTELFGNQKFVNAFKNGLINNIASKYDLETTQITVSSVEKDGMTSFQVMPFYIENLEDFQKKMDQIDDDLNTHEFRSVLPAIALSINKDKPKGSKWNRYAREHPGLALYIAAILIGVTAFILAGIFIVVFRNRIKHSGRSESKSPICETSYHQAATEDDHYHAVHAPDGTAYVVVETEDMSSSNDKRALV